MRNPFSTSLAASLYAKGRPFYHPLIADQIRSALGKDLHVRRALDIACGTGLSTRILLEFADSVTGCDDAKAMIDEALLDPRITYHNAPTTAFDDEQFDLITLGSGLHWLDGGEFLREATRLLTTDGHLAIYDHGFSGEMACNPDYGCWHRNHYLPRFPSPPRSASAIDPAAAEHLGLVGVLDHRFSHPWPMSSPDLVSYLLTQSNLLTVIAADATVLETVRTWLQRETAPFFRLPRESFRFVGNVAIWRKADNGQRQSGQTSPIHIRQYQRDDHSAVVDLWERCGLVDLESRPVAEGDIARKLQVQPELFLIGTLGAELVATGMAGYDGHRGHLYYLAVCPKHRGRQFGRQMVSRIEALLRDRGCRRLTLFVSGDNLEVTGFYERLGFSRSDVVSMGKDIHAGLACAE